MVVGSEQLTDRQQIVNYMRPASDALQGKYASHSTKIEDELK